jgi:hypothetical protein
VQNQLVHQTPSWGRLRACKWLHQFQRPHHAPIGSSDFWAAPNLALTLHVASFFASRIANLASSWSQLVFDTLIRDSMVPCSSSADEVVISPPKWTRCFAEGYSSKNRLYYMLNFHTKSRNESQHQTTKSQSFILRTTVTKSISLIPNKTWKRRSTRR